MKKLPVALIVAFALQLCMFWGRDLLFMSGQLHSLTALILTLGAAHLAVVTSLAIGLSDLAQRTTGRARIAIQIAMAFAIALVGVQLVELAHQALATAYSETWWDFKLTAAWLLNLGMVVAIAIAASNRLAIAAVVVSVAFWLPDVLHFQLVDLIPHVAQRLVTDVMVTMRVGVVVALLASIPSADASPRPALALRGLSLATQGFYLRIVGFAATVLLGMVVLGNRGRSADDFALLAMYGGFIANACAFALVGLGALKALRSTHDALDSLAMGFAAVANLWCAGAMLNKLAVYYNVTNGRSNGADDLAALDLALPIVATIGGVFLTIALARFARERGDAPLATSAAASGVGYAMLMIASTGIAGYLITSAKSFEGMIGMMLVAALCGLASQIIIARLCKRTEDALADGASLPIATVV